MQHHYDPEELAKPVAEQIYDLQDRRELAPTEALRLDLNRTFVAAEGEPSISGRKLLTLELTGHEDQPQITIVDLRAEPIVAYNRSDGSGALRDMGGIAGGGRLMVSGDFAMVMRSADGQQTEVYGLNPQAAPVVIGRGEQGYRPNAGSTTPGMLPPTVSRTHCAVEIDKNDILTIESLNPTFAMAVRRPEADAFTRMEEQQAAAKVEDIIRRLPEGTDSTVVMHNLSMLYGPNSPMSRQLYDARIGTGGTMILDDGKAYPWAQVNAYADNHSGRIIAVDRVRNLPQEVTSGSKAAYLFVAMDHQGDRGFFAIPQIDYRDGESVQVPQLENARDPVELSAAAYNELQS